MKKEKGITMLSLIVTIVVLSIIVGISITAGLTVSKQTKDKKLQAEIQMVQHAVLEQYQKYKVTKDASSLKGSGVTKTVVDAIIPDSEGRPTKATGYYRLNPTVLEQIGIQKAEDTYLVNYETGMVVNESTKSLSTGELLYLPEIQQAS